LEILSSENLIEEKDLKLKNNKAGFQTYIALLIIVVTGYIISSNTDNDMIAYFNGTLVLFASVVLLIILTLKLVIPFFKKTNR